MRKQSTNFAFNINSYSSPWFALSFALWAIFFCIVQGYSVSNSATTTVLARDRRLEEAVFIIKWRYRLVPLMPKHTTISGSILSKGGDIDEAIFRFKEALRIKPDFKDAESNLEIALKKAEKD